MLCDYDEDFVHKIELFYAPEFVLNGLLIADNIDCFLAGGEDYSATGSASFPVKDYIGSPL